MSEFASIGGLLARWYDTGDARSARDAIRLLEPQLRLAADVERALSDRYGPTEIFDLRQRAFAKIFDREQRLMDRADNPIAYAKKILRNEALDALRKRRHLLESTSEEAVHSLFEAQSPVEPPSGVLLDLDPALAALESLSLTERVSLLLVSLPDRISDEEWAEFTAVRPPPPPVRPTEALDDDAASRLVESVASQESGDERRRRMGTFGRRNRRSLAKLRRSLEVDDERED